MTIGTIRGRAAVSLVALGLVLSLGACTSASVAGDPEAGTTVSTPEGSSGVAAVSGPVQRISVDLSQGYYDPTVIEAKAGIPLEITFGQGQGCLAKVLIPAFSVDQDLTSGGAVVRLPAMKPGEYQFSCAMRMVFGKIVVD